MTPSLPGSSSTGSDTGPRQHQSAAEAPKQLLKSQSKASQIRRKAIEATISLKERGWACIEGILDAEDCKAYVDGFWDWIEGLGSGVDRNDPKSWRAPVWPPSYRGIINSLEVAHQAFVWRVRKHPAVTQIFAELWGSDALLSSFDSINAVPAVEVPPEAGWLHVDQAPHRRGIACIQGLVNLVDVDPNTTGTLLVKDGSHVAHDTFFTEISKISAEEQAACIDHYKFAPEEIVHFDTFRSVAIRGKAGSLFLWDSRTVHANTLPARLSSMRHVVYTCYQPASMALEADLQQKRFAYQDFRLTTHWPAMNIRLYEDEKAVEYYGADGGSNKPQFKINRTRHEVEDHRILQLAGVEAYTPEEARHRKPLLEYSVEELRGIL